MALLFLILFIGILTTFTDLKAKRIYNQHLAAGAIFGLIAIGYTAIFKHENVLFHFINGSAAFLIGFLLHKSSLWRGGDAKLFTLFAFLMPIPTYNHTLFPCVINLFACSFLAGTIILIPAFIKDITIHHKAIANDLLLPEKQLALFDAIGTLIFFSWFLFPIYYLARITDPVIILTISYLIFNWGYNLKGKKPGSLLEHLRKMSLPLLIGFIFGLASRLWLDPSSLTFASLTKYLTRISISVIISTLIHTTFNHFKDYQERISFAPLLFIGCMLSFTPFLTKLIQLVMQWNVLLYH